MSKTINSIRKYTKTSLIFGFGINDVDYNVKKHEKIDGKYKITWVCPYYVKWHSMIRRCYSVSLHQNSPTYVGCTVDHTWKKLSDFIKWVDSQPNKDWRVCDLDKDILIKGNMVYSPHAVVFIKRSVNMFLTDHRGGRGDYLIGVSFKKKIFKFQAECSDPFKINQPYLGVFSTELEAHKAWQTKKHEYACMLADLQEDKRVAKALRERYAPDKDWIDR